MFVGKPEFAENQEPRVACQILVDVSTSMEGAPIQELNQGLSVLKDELMRDPVTLSRVELSVIEFGDNVETIVDFTSPDHFNPPRLVADGWTPMGEAIHNGLDALENRKREYRENGIVYYRPWVLLLTDGAPTDSWHDAAHRVREGEENKDFLFFAIGVEGADMETLSRIAPDNRPPMMLKGLNFKGLFQWLSASLSQAGRSQSPGQQVMLASAAGWGVASS